MDEQYFQSVWRTESSSIPQADSVSDFDNFKERWNVLTASPLETCQVPQSHSNYYATNFKKPQVQMSDVGVQTMATSMLTFPIACRTQPVPWGLHTEEPSPLTTHNLTADQSYKSMIGRYIHEFQTNL